MESVCVLTGVASKTADCAGSAAKLAVAFIAINAAFEAAMGNEAVAVEKEEWLMERMIRQREPLLEGGWARI
jgi:hypothetical protein